MSCLRADCSGSKSGRSRGLTAPRQAEILKVQPLLPVCEALKVGENLPLLPLLPSTLSPTQLHSPQPNFSPGVQTLTLVYSINLISHFQKELSFLPSIPSTPIPGIEKMFMLFNKWYWESWITICKRLKLDPYLIPNTKINLKWIKPLIIRIKIIKISEENIGKKLHDIGFLDRTLKIPATGQA